ncbi:MULTISPECIES: branched-chain amino acid ABC transporter permease [unclassified Chelatococcus]|uniref:branched-chain amino acid ABC transporter permease n=1 Tax=unclassified Chelatococcus TaxID=2638111 RepID=UPI001BCABD7C|nr:MULTISPECIES: branched-chain amino acid ABC transporter permease [unclassified Chelatococcus]MBS7743493.1 branched-chain amino acid ABC transporter permease [Chelatococcus sp. HY11]MBX3547067.1 branched-chain amino acid ABC transporter permease [Chelatococcus sp.]CAH1662458.1 High-affinity branched-chain amino acid transport system permease protein LivH (TC 3.A.1.4.1) [Hyphomicrobiales bacterium]CAH1687634.1 High-affinity branched-chain amino acid transport system permease protein LivH (TC 3
MEWFVVSLINGAVYGLLLFMVSAGLTLVFGMMGVLNFAHASFYMIGAYAAFVVSSLFGFWWGLLFGPIFVALIGLGVERWLLRPVHKYGHASELLITFGLAFVFEEFVKVLFGHFIVNYKVPDVLRFPAFQLFGSDYPFYRLFVALVALVLLGTLFVVLRFTRIGIVVRAAVQRPEMTGALGHNVSAVFMVTFGIGAWMAGVAGAVGGALLTVNPNMAIEMSILTFVVVIVGGLGSLAGAFIASLLIGLLTTFSIGISVSLTDIGRMIGLGESLSILGSVARMNLSTYASAVPVLVMLLVLLTRPSGLMGDRR